MDTQQTATALVEALRRAAHAEGPAEAGYLLATIADDVARAQVEDPYALADLLAEEHRILEEARLSWDQRDRAWQYQRGSAKDEISAIQKGLEDVLHELAVAHRRRTREATLALPSGSKVKTTESKQVEVKITDAEAFMAAVAGREDLPPGMITQPPLALGIVAAKAYAKVAFDVEGGEVPPGAELILPGRMTSIVSHEARNAAK